MDPNQSKNNKFNLISVWFDKISKRFLCVCSFTQCFNWNCVDCNEPTTDIFFQVMNGARTFFKHPTLEMRPEIKVQRLTSYLVIVGANWRRYSAKNSAAKAFTQKYHANVCFRALFCITLNLLKQRDHYCFKKIQPNNHWRVIS